MPQTTSARLRKIGAEAATVCPIDAIGNHLAFIGVNQYS
jgi:hypothetical protein